MKIQPFLGRCRRRFQRRVLPEGDIGYFLAWWFGIRRSAVTGSLFLFFLLLLSQKSENEKKRRLQVVVALVWALQGRRSGGDRLVCGVSE